MFQGFQFPKTILIWFDAHPGSAGWMQAIVAGIAIVAVYLAATIPVRAEAKAREAERRLRAWGLALLLTPEIRLHSEFAFGGERAKPFYSRRALE
jgi:hypothetical protein